MTRLVFELLRPYRGRLAIVFVAMLIEIGTGLAAPWPLKLVIDDALGNHHLPHWLDWAHEYGGFGKHTLGVALFAGAATLAIAVVGASRPCSSTPAFSHLSIIRRITPSVTRLSRNARR
jgi:ABC-type multidrug transport system fused ATPase/permease subunit